MSQSKKKKFIVDPSKIRSFEKNPERKGKPQRHNKHTTTLEDKKGVILANMFILRKSWFLSSLWIKTPETINKDALKSAWQTRWKKQKKNKPLPNEKTMKPNWLNVEKAINFFISHSKIAIKPAIDKVSKDTITRIKFTEKSKKLKRIIKKIPAVTRVEEWTKEETGVGAAIAAGNQDEKGNWALLVIKVKIKITDKRKDLCFKLIKFQSPRKYISPKLIKKNISPKRLVRNVSIPALLLEKLI